MRTTQDIKKNGNYRDVRSEKDSIFTVSLFEKTTLKYYNLVNKATDDRRMCVKKEAEFNFSLRESVVLPFETIKALSY